MSQRRGDPGASQSDGPADSLLDLVAGHPRDQVQAAVDALGQVAKVGAAAQVIGTHGQHHIDRSGFGPACFDEQFDKGGGFFPGGRPVSCDAFVTEDLFKLVHEDQQVLVFRESALVRGFDEPEGSAAQRQLDAADTEDPFERPGESAHRHFAGHALDDAPVRRNPAQQAGAKGGEEAGSHQGRFAAAGASDHRDEAGFAQLLERFANLVIAAEEEVDLLFIEIAQTLKWNSEARVHGGCHRPPPGAAAPCTIPTFNLSMKGLRASMGMDGE